MSERSSAPGRINAYHGTDLGIIRIGKDTPPEWEDAAGQIAIIIHHPGHDSLFVALTPEHARIVASRLLALADGADKAEAVAHE